MRQHKVVHEYSLTPNNKGMKYELNDKPGIVPMLMYGLQWMAVSIPTIIMLGAIISKMHYTNVNEQIVYMQKMLGLTGATLVVQVLWGHRLPLVLGPASILLIGILASASASVSAIYTAVLTGGLFLSALAFSGLLSKVQSIFTPRVVIVILSLIAFTLTPVILRLILGGTTPSFLNLIFGLLLALGMVVANELLKGIWKATVVLGGLVLGSLVYFQFHPNPETVTHPASTVTSGIAFLNLPLEFDAGVTLSFLFCFIALIVNELGSIQSIGQLIGVSQLKERTVRGMGVIGLSNMAAGLLGVVGPVDYSLSPGIISATGCASRYPLAVSGIGLCICAFFSGIVLVISNIPSVVVGAVLLYLMSSQFSAGMQMLVREKAVHHFGHGIIIGFPLMVALLLSFAPHETLNQVPALIRPIAANGFVIGVIVVLVLEHVVFRRNENEK